MGKTPEVYRVSYGKIDTPKEDCEYRILGQSPVGTMAEIAEYIKGRGYTKIVAWDAYGNVIEQEMKIN